jgi:spore coat protein U-like protein
MNTKLNLKKLALAIGAMALAGSAMAANDTSTTLTTATISPACAVANGNGLAFSELIMLDFDLATNSSLASPAAGTFQAICTNGTATPTFSYVSGNSTGTDFVLKGADTTTTIVYSLYGTNNQSGDVIVGGAATAHSEFTSTGLPQTLNLSAKIIAADRNAKPIQAYSDTITITANYAL